MSDNTLKILLKQLDFSDKEIQIYLTLLQEGELSPQKISKLTNINRSTVYAVCDDLCRLGVIKKNPIKSTSSYLALDPVELQKLYKQDEKDLIIKKAKINSAITELEKIAKDTQYTIPKITFVTEEEINKYLHERSAEWDKEMAKANNIWWGFQDASFVDHYEKWIDWYWQQNNPDIVVQLLSNLTLKEESIKTDYPRRKIKFLNRKHNFDSTIWLIGDFVVIIQTQEKPFYLYEIHEPQLANSMRFMLSELWDQEQ